MIEVDNLVKYYGDKKILHNLKFTVSSKRVCGLLGPNGSGKSTTMDILAGLLGPSSGTAKICGLDIIKQTEAVKACVGYLPDNPPLHKEMHVYDFINYVAKLRGLKVAQTRKKAVDSIIAECDIHDVANRIIAHLSKGYRQRVALAAALVHKPQVLILDEPTEGLDPNQIVHIRNLIKKLAAQRTVIMSSHILSEVQATCDEVIIINHGHIATTMSLENKGIQTAYLYSFADRLEEALHCLQQNSLVASAQIYPNGHKSILVKFNENLFFAQNIPANLAKLSAELAANNLPLIGLEAQRDCLEEIFFNVIRTQPNALA